MNEERESLVRSIRERLVRHAKEIRVEPNLIFTRYAVERFLYRLSCSPHGDRFVLKGALLLLVWLGETLRPTRDADVLGFGDLSDEALRRVFEDVCATEVEPDAVLFDPESIRVVAIREEAAYGGQRVTLWGKLGRARLRVQVDVGIGDKVVPEPEWLDYPALLDLPAPRMRCYPPEVAIAEKLHAMVVLGSRNSRMRDFYDVFVLSERRNFEGERLVAAVRNTFERRRTPIPEALPLALSPEFAEIEGKQRQWEAFLGKGRIEPVSGGLDSVVRGLAEFLGPALEGAQSDGRYDASWPPGGPWAQGT